MAKKILFLLHLPPPVHGAAQVGQIIKDSKLINENFSCKFINISTSKSIDDIGFSFKKIPELLHLFVRILKEANAFKPDLVYLTPNAGGNVFFLKDFVIYILIRHLKTKFIFHYHNKGVSKGNVREKLYRFFFKNNYVILLGKELKEEFNSLLDNKNVFLCPNGVKEIFHEELIPCKNNTHKLNFLYLSNLISEKGILVLLDACELLAREGNDFVCTIVGAESKEISRVVLEEEIMKRNLEDKIVYKGPCYGDDKILCYKNADVFVLPTYYHNECCPLVLLEAMQFYLPCISTDVGCIPSMIDNKKNGFIIPPKNKESLSSVMKSLILDYSLVKNMGYESYKKYSSLYTIDKFEERLLEIFKCVTEK